MHDSEITVVKYATHRRDSNLTASAHASVPVYTSLDGRIPRSFDVNIVVLTLRLLCDR